MDTVDGSEIQLYNQLRLVVVIPMIDFTKTSQVGKPPPDFWLPSTGRWPFSIRKNPTNPHGFRMSRLTKWRINRINRCDIEIIHLHGQRFGESGGGNEKNNMDLPQEVFLTWSLYTAMPTPQLPPEPTRWTTNVFYNKHGFWSSSVSSKKRLTKKLHKRKLTWLAGKVTIWSLYFIENMGIFQSC